MEYGYNNRYVFYASPPSYDAWGFHPVLGMWQHSICVIDDFGDAVPVSGFHHGHEDEPVWAPGPTNDYVEHHPTVH